MSERCRFAELGGADGLLCKPSPGHGRTVHARTAIVTIPRSKPRKPLLPSRPCRAAKVEGCTLGQVARSAKVWFRPHGEHPPFAALGASDWPMNFFQVEYTLDGDTIAVRFGPDPSNIDVEDPAAVQAQLERLVPGAEVAGVNALRNNN